MAESHMETTNREERQSDALSSTTVTTHVSVHSTSCQESYNGTTLHSISHRESAGQDQISLQVPLSETLPTDMSDTTESDAEKHATTGECKSASLWHLYFHSGTCCVV
jgi:hypothetical protein